MDNCFRFLINVDQCLNMSAFDMFFYKLESRHKFQGYNVQLFGNSYGSSLRNAAMQIRAYLDKYPYHIGDMQLLVAMRAERPSQPVGWEQTLLYRLLQLSGQLQNARIFLHSHEGSEKVLNLIMLYDGDASQAAPASEGYLSSRRFREDCALMLAQLGLHEQESSREAVEAALAEYEATDGHDGVLAACIRGYAASAAGYEGTFFAGLSSYLEARLANYQVFEANIDRNDRRQNMLALLRVVEFINMPVDGNGDGVTALSKRCLENWNKAWTDKELERRYGQMLCRYRQRLSNAAGELERPGLHVGSSLPPRNAPGEKDIVCPNSMFGASGKKTGDVTAPVKKFLRIRTPRLSQWKECFSQLQSTLGALEQQLEKEARQLQEQYAAALEQRKRQTQAWQTAEYVAGPEAEQERLAVEEKRSALFREMHTRRIDPGTRSQDRRNIQAALEQADASVQAHLAGLSSISIGFFLLFMLLCTVGVVALYTLQQTYVFQDERMLVYYLIYVGVLLAGSVTFYRMPHDHFRERIAQDLDRLQKKLEEYIPRYCSQAENFARYVNILNQLDELSRYHRLLTYADQNARRLSQCCLWHKVQLDKHLQKLEQFRGLMELSCETQDDEAACVLSVRDMTVTDVMNSPIYWPQGESGL